MNVLAQETIELRFLCFNEGNDSEVYDDLLSQFSQENPGVAVAVDIVPQAEVGEALALRVLRP